MEHIEAWLAGAEAHRRETGRPLVSLSYAQSLDGCIAAHPGEPFAISEPESLRLTHRLRAAHAAILVGIGTVLADNPRLTVRLAQGPNPQPIVLDSRLRFPLDAALLNGPRRPLIAALQDAPAAKQAALKSAGARLLLLPPGPDGRVSLPALLTHLAELGTCSLMVEGGAGVITAFLTEDLADQLILTIAPVFIGGVRAVGRKGIIPGPLPRLLEPRYESSGIDLIVSGKLSI